MICVLFELKFTVLVPAVNVPSVPLMKFPPAFKVPAPEKVIWDARPAEVMLPDTFTVPVETETTVLRGLGAVVVPLRVMDAAVKVPVST